MPRKSNTTAKVPTLAPLSFTVEIAGQTISEMTSDFIQPNADAPAFPSALLGTAEGASVGGMVTTCEQVKLPTPPSGKRADGRTHGVRRSWATERFVSRGTVVLAEGETADDDLTETIVGKRSSVLVDPGADFDPTTLDHLAIVGSDGSAVTVPLTREAGVSDDEGDAVRFQWSGADMVTSAAGRSWPIVASVKLRTDGKLSVFAKVN